MAHDTDLFNRWEAGQGLARDLMVKLTRAIQSGHIPESDHALRGYVDALNTTLADASLDPGYKALALGVPTVSEILQHMDTADPLAIYEAAGLLKRAIADGCQAELHALYDAMSISASGAETKFSPGAKSAGYRALKNACLSILSVQGHFEVKALAKAQFETATNMTEELASMMVLLRMLGNDGQSPNKDIYETRQRFYKKWKDNPLVIDKWFSAMAQDATPNSLPAIAKLLRHDAYEPNNPNRVRALLGGLTLGNPKTFHAENGAGYTFFTNQILDMDTRNPSVAARLLGAYEIWPKLDKNRQELIKTELKRVIDSNPSKNVLEIASKALGT